MAALDIETDPELQVSLNRLQALHSEDDANEVLLIQKLRGLVTNVKWSHTCAVELFDALLKRFESTTAHERSALHPWMMKMLHFIEINYVTPNLKLHKGKTVIQLVNDGAISDERLLEMLGCDTDKSLDEILEEIRQQKSHEIDKTLLNELKDIVSSVDEILCSGTKVKLKKTCLKEDLKENLLNLCWAVEKTKRYKPRLTQMVSWCLMALSNSGWLIQVGTGEGKSCIVAMFAAFRALKGEKVDIMSSSPVLAERDMNEWREFYQCLNISAACNTHEFEDMKNCYECMVVYGTAHHFAGDWLRHHFQRTDILGCREFQCVIVDEVDSLMLDNSLQMVYLGSEMPAMQHLNPLLALIWATVSAYNMIDSKTTAGPIYSFHDIMFQNITASEGADKFTILQMAEDTGTLPRGSVQEIRNNPRRLTDKISSVTTHQVVEFFKTVEMRFPSCHFSLYRKNSDGILEKLNSRKEDDKCESRNVPLLLLNGGFCRNIYSDEETVWTAAEEKIKHFLRFTPCELTKDTNICFVPGFLKELVNAKLKVWIENAFYAKTLNMGHEYIIEDNEVVPVDYSCTGVVQNNVKWTDGLQQFLEMKHQVSLSEMAVITNYMSNVGLLQKYGKQIYGISGTLGHQSEIKTLKKIYGGIRTCEIPYFKRRKLFEVEGIITDNVAEWSEKIFNAVLAQITPTSFRGPRAVLVICETIIRALALHCRFKDLVQPKNLYINNNMDNSAIFERKLEPGEVIIATNLAGRGTDLKVSGPVKAAGGLFVVQTFLPKNARVEQQAYGRTAREGSPGSAQLIICSSHLPEHLKLLTALDQFDFLLRNMIDWQLPHQEHFITQFRLYQKSLKEEDHASLSSTLSRFLTRPTHCGVKTAKIARDEFVGNRLSDYLANDIPKLKKKEELFICYLSILDDLYRCNSNKPRDSEVSSLNETWGMWLLMSFNETDTVHDLKSRLEKDMQIARQKLALNEPPSSIPHHYTSFGNDLRKKGKLADSVRMYSKAIEEDHCWVAIALYNRAFASLAQQNQNQDRNCINQALKDLNIALKSVAFFCREIEVTCKNSKSTAGTNLSHSITRFDKQMGAKKQIWECFKDNVSEGIRKLERARETGGNVKVQEELVHFIFPAESLYTMTVAQLLIPILSTEPRVQRSLIVSPVFDRLREISRFQSLGLTCIFTLDTLFSLGGFLKKFFNLS